MTALSRAVMLLALLALAACAREGSSPRVEPPANVRAEALTGAIRVSWDYAGAPGVGFNVYRAVGAAKDASFVKLTPQPLVAERRSFDDAEVTAGVFYRYAVSALGPEGESRRVESPAPVEARPEAPSAGEVRLEVLRGGSGQGVVTSEPAGIDCIQRPGVSSDCREAFEAGTIVTLTAAPDPGSSFAGWSGLCGGTERCELTLATDTTVTATFAPAQATLRVEREGPGKVVSINVEGIDCGDDCSESYGLGIAVGLQAVPNEGSVFTGWSGACSGAGGCNVEMESDRSVSAAFAKATLPPVISSFVAAPDKVKAGDEATLTWRTENAERLRLTGSDGLSRDVTGRTSTKVRVTRETIYTLEASNADGSTTRTVTVRVGKAPVIGSFSAAPEVVGPGEPVRLSWQVSGDGPLTLSIDRGVGVVSGRSGATVQPTATTSYTLTAENPYGKATARLEVVVKPRYSLSVVREGRRQSRVTSEPAGIDCGSTCAEGYLEGTEVALEVAEVKDLERWYVCDQPTSAFRWLFCAEAKGKRLELTLTRDKFVYAVFKN